MGASQAEYPDAMEFGRAVPGAVRDESLRSMPLFAIGFNADAPVHEHVNVANTRHVILGFDPKTRPDEADAAKRFEPGLAAAVDETQNPSEAVRCPAEKFDEFVLGNEPLVESGFHAGQCVDVVEARQRLQHGVKW